MVEEHYNTIVPAKAANFPHSNRHSSPLDSLRSLEAGIHSPTHPVIPTPPPTVIPTPPPTVIPKPPPTVIPAEAGIHFPPSAKVILTPLECAIT